MRSHLVLPGSGVSVTWMSWRVRIQMLHSASTIPGCTLSGLATRLSRRRTQLRMLCRPVFITPCAIHYPICVAPRRRRFGQRCRQSRAPNLEFALPRAALFDEAAHGITFKAGSASSNFQSQVKVTLKFVNQRITIEAQHTSISYYLRFLESIRHVVFTTQLHRLSDIGIHQLTFLTIN